ncbi:ubiquitin carboxyl-terminal hydrolase 37 [Bombina bombina]|uniref:ubiquitin carboxyl-terminal hydrolase 37 n=1 Tax=Bombina bombina TaxID=8345 RepID=UPI00235B0855|nr:ubiquitin carboxyl-terminal hydrolase 37 [Bombina bombina]
MVFEYWCADPHRIWVYAADKRSEKRKRMQTPSPEINEDYPKENDSSIISKAFSDPARKFLNSSREKQINLKQSEENRQGLTQLQSSSFYGSKMTPKDYSAGSIFSERLSGTNQPPAAKRSLILSSQSAPNSVKKLKPNQDYTGWNKPRLPLSTQPLPQQLQGFSNLGNTCYMNSILQSLFSLQSFANDLLKQGIPWKKIPVNALIRRFALLLLKKDICGPEMKKELLKRVKSSISATAERFSGYMQNDAHEFLSQCLDQLKEDMEKLNKSWKTEPYTGDIPSGRAIDDITTTRVYTCPVTCNLEFEVQHSITCKMCGETVTKREQFNDLSIDLPRGKKSSRSIQDSLDLFFRMEEIEYSCEKCNGKTSSVTHKFSRLPRILILHLKRYSFNVVLSLNNKVVQQVVIPRYLTLSSHCTESTRPPLSLGWNAQTAISRPLKVSQMVNASTVTTLNSVRKHTLKSTSVLTTCLDSESDDEPLKRCVSHSQRVCDVQVREQQIVVDHIKRSSVEGTKCSESGSSFYDGLSDEDLMAAVLQMSRKEVSLSITNEEEEKITSSPDTGIDTDTGLDDLNEIFDNYINPMEEEKSKVVREPDLTQYSDISKDFDENKENKTPEGPQREADWLQYELESEREEQELQQALVQSLQEQSVFLFVFFHEEFNNTFCDGMGSDEDSGNEDTFDMEYTEEEAEALKKNTETGNLPHSYRLISVVSHIGSSSSSGHYISDVYDVKKQAWFTYNDLSVSRTQETTVQTDRDKSGYIFFYMHKGVFEELIEAENVQPVSIDLNRPTRPPL